MKLFRDSLRGLIVSCSVEQSMALDFAVQNASGRILMAQANWWRGYWGLSAGIEFVTGTLTYSGNGAWRVDRGTLPIVYFNPSEDDEETKAIREARKWQDAQREEYMQELAKLQQLNSEWDVSYWLEIWTRRPRKDPARRRYAALRPIAKILLMGLDGRALDAMAFDGNGHATTVTKHPWLTTLANEWIADDGPRMSLADRLTQLMDLCPPGEYSLSSPQFETAAITVDAAAQAALTQGNRD